MIQAMYTFIRKIHRDTKAGILNKPALNLILGLNMILIWIHKLRMGLGNLSDTVQMLVHIGNTVLPYLIDPILCRERIFQYAAISVKSSPDHSSTDLFVLHEGTKVRVVSEMENWAEVVIADGKKGWTEKRNFEKI